MRLTYSLADAEQLRNRFKEIGFALQVWPAHTDVLDADGNVINTHYDSNRLEEYLSALELRNEHRDARDALHLLREEEWSDIELPAKADGLRVERDSSRTARFVAITKSNRSYRSPTFKHASYMHAWLSGWRTRGVFETDRRGLMVSVERDTVEHAAEKAELTLKQDDYGWTVTANADPDCFYANVSLNECYAFCQGVINSHRTSSEKQPKVEDVRKLLERHQLELEEVENSITRRSTYVVKFLTGYRYECSTLREVQHYFFGYLKGISVLTTISDAALDTLANAAGLEIDRREKSMFIRRSHSMEQVGCYPLDRNDVVREFITGYRTALGDKSVTLQHVISEAEKIDFSLCHDVRGFGLVRNGCAIGGDFPTLHQALAWIGGYHEAKFRCEPTELTTVEIQVLRDALRLKTSQDRKRVAEDLAVAVGYGNRSIETTSVGMLTKLSTREKEILEKLKVMNNARN